MSEGQGIQVIKFLGGVILGGAAWFAALVLGLFASSLFSLTIGGLGWIQAVLLLVLAIVLARRLRQTWAPLEVGMLVSISIGILISAACGVSNPKIGG